MQPLRHQKARSSRFYMYFNTVKKQLNQLNIFEIFIRVYYHLASRVLRTEESGIVHGRYKFANVWKKKTNFKSQLTKYLKCKPKNKLNLNIICLPKWSSVNGN